MEAPRRRVTIIGAGYVGLVTAVGLAKLGHRIELVETRRDRFDALRAGRVPIHEEGLQSAFDDECRSGRLTIADRPSPRSEVALVCVGTPIRADGSSDLSDLESAVAEVAPLLDDDVPLVVRSTLPPGSTQLIPRWSGLPAARILTNPEFLRQGTALADFLSPTRIVIGRFPSAAEGTIQRVVELFDRLDAPRLVVDVASVELIKNGSNAFLALKLSFTNEMASLSEEYGADIDEVLAGITLDPRIGREYMRPAFGFGGSCLPKELQAIANAGHARGLDMHVMSAASAANRASKDRFADRVVAAIGGLSGRTIAILGLAFKAGTDDVRDAPSLAIAATFLAGGATVRAYDPQASSNAERALPGLKIVDSAAAAVAGADIAVLATDWPEFLRLDWRQLGQTMRTAIVIDGRRMLEEAEMSRLGFRYLAVGTPHRPTTDRPAFIA